MLKSTMEYNNLEEIEVEEFVETSDQESECFDQGSELVVSFDQDSEYSDQESDKQEFNYVKYNTDSFQDVDCSNYFINTYESNNQELKDAYIVVVSDNITQTDSIFQCPTLNNKEINELLSIHNSSKECEICHLLMDTNSYSKHIKSHRESYKKHITNNKIQCNKCGKTVVKSYLKYHMLIHGSDNDKLNRMKQCPICDKYVKYYYLSDHMKRMHLNTKEKVYENVKTCPICDRSVRESKIKEHMGSHGKPNIKQYVCEQCGKIFKYYSPFRTHLLTHTGDLTYKCEYCPYRGLHLGLLKIHVRTHTKNYAYECSICKKRFITKSNLSQHEKVHRPPEYSCFDCGKEFIHKRHLDVHINVVHLNIRDVKCVCGKVFGTKNALKAHERKIHNMQSHSYRGRPASYLKAELSVQNKLLQQVLLF